MKIIIHLCLLLSFATLSYSQSSINGSVSDENGQPLIGVNITEDGTDNGTVSDFNGDYIISVNEVPTTLTFSYIGFTAQAVTVDMAGADVSVVMTEGVGLDEIIVMGNRAKPRTILDSPVPVDNINVRELKGSGKPILERMLTYKVPSFNSQNQAISDATAHYDPADLRGLGPSRTLVLINGKRKNQSAQVYLNRTTGKGEVGTDLKSIPVAAIERVEVLRDGASAQYGSDAIAGVINMVLKKGSEYSSLTASTGITSEGDGFNYATDFNTTFNFGEGGSANFTLGYFNQKLTNRAGSAGVKDLPGDARDNEKRWANETPTLGMHVGQPDMVKKDVFVNITQPIGEKAEFYTFGGYTTRTGKSFAYYRAPYWRRDVADANFITSRPDDFIGYQPTFEALINDHINSAGIKFEIGDGFMTDASVTYGSNDVHYTVNNSVNRDYLKDTGSSPRTFKPGGYKLSNVIGNLDFTKLVNEQISVALGGEYKKEYFTAYEGNPLSYYKGGSDSFAGIKPAEAGEWDRTNLALYAQVDYDFNESFLVGAAGRFEDYSDFGNNFSWKINSRYKIGNKSALRASYSTGFRAPTLHQRYLTNSQYIIVAGSSEPLLQGTLANDNPAVVALGVPNLFAETSKNISAGFTHKFNNNFNFSFDFYDIRVDDRVLFSSQIGALDGTLDGSDAVENILIANNVVAVQFFINAGNTKTQGADIILNYRGDNGWGAILAANFNTTTIDAITTPSALKDAGYNIFDRQEQGLIINSRPKSKILLGLNYTKGNWRVDFNNTMFGKVTITAPSGGFGADGVETVNGMDQELSPKVVTDVSLHYDFSENFAIFGTVNNLFDVYPDVTLESTNTSQAGNRFVYSSEVQQQGQLGMNFSVGANIKF